MAIKIKIRKNLGFTQAPTFKKFKSGAGFTLIELLIVIAIIGILSTLVFFGLKSSRLKARDARRVNDIKQITNAIEMYNANKGYYPQYLSNVRCNLPNSLVELVNEGLMQTVAVDPINTSTPNPRLCYEYMGIGTAANYSFTSAWYCSGRRRTDYQWFIHFSTESASFNFPRLTNSAGTPNNQYTYCIHGQLR